MKGDVLHEEFLATTISFISSLSQLLLNKLYFFLLQLVNQKDLQN